MFARYVNRVGPSRMDQSSFSNSTTNIIIPESFDDPSTNITIDVPSRQSVTDNVYRVTEEIDLGQVVEKSKESTKKGEKPSKKKREKSPKKKEEKVPKIKTEKPPKTKIQPFRMPEVACTAPEKYRKKLREVRPYVEIAHEHVLCMLSAVERAPLKHATCGALRQCSERLSKLLETATFDVWPHDREVIRDIRNLVVVLETAIEQFEFAAVDYNASSQRVWLGAKLGTLKPDAQNRIVAELLDAEITLRNFIAWIDGKCQRRFWLPETIRYVRIACEFVALIAAAVTVAMVDLTPAIVTLCFVIASGLFEIVETVIDERSREKFAWSGRQKTFQLAPGPPFSLMPSTSRASPGSTMTRN